MGAMIVGLVIRNVCDVAHVELPMRAIDVSGNVSLNVFLAVALMTLKLWELALPGGAHDHHSGHPDLHHVPVRLLRGLPGHGPRL